MGETAQRLAKVAGSLQACNLDGLSGQSSVVLVFENSGQPRSAKLAPGSQFEGTKTGDCVLLRFMEIRVPPFDGPVFTTQKNFRIP
jgi:hypothetical protein